MITGAAHGDAGTGFTADVPPPWPREDIELSNGIMSLRHAAHVEGFVAEPAMFVHGLGGSSANWTDLMAHLREGLDSIAPDLPGFGWSPPPRDGDYSPRRTATTLAELVTERFDGRPVHLFGNSMGGAIAVQLAARYPDVVRSLTLVSPALPKRGLRRTSVHLPVIATPGLGATLMKRYLTLDAATRAKATIDLCFANPDALPAARRQEAIDELRRRDALPYVADAFLQSLRGLMATYLDVSQDRPWKLAERITCPTLLVYGRADKLVDPIHAHTRAFPDVRVLVLPHAGHVAQIEQPALVAEAWRRLLSTAAAR